MVSMALKQETNSEVAQSQQLFPLRVSTEQSSLNYMKRLTAVAISNILYLRNVFTEDCYGHRKLDHLKLRILTERCETMGAKQIVNWVKGCFDAMEKKYLKQLTLGIYTDPSDPDELIEAYTFRFTYDSNQFNCDISLNQNNGEVVIDKQSATSELRNSTVQLLRSLIIMVQSLDRLPNDCFLNIKLLYYDDITPEDYEPPGFVPSDKDSFTFKGKPISISAGEVITSYHTLKVKIRTNQEQFQDLAPSQSSNINQMEELRDECSPLKLNDSFDENRDSQHSSQRADTKTGSHLMQKKSKSPIKSSKNFVKQEIKPSINSKENSRVRCGHNTEKSVESNVISKMKDMKVDDNYSQKDEKRSTEVNKRKHVNDWEVTQDSVFNSMPIADKRFKASKSNKTVNIRNRR